RGAVRMRAPAIAVVLLAAAAPAQQRVEFERDVLPILRERCFDCHRATHTDARGRLREPKGGLRLDGREALLAGGEGGQVVDREHPDDSELLLRVRLPADDPDVMPAKGDRLADGQISTLRAWIAQGADFGDWVGEPLGRDGAAAPAEALPVTALE